MVRRASLGLAVAVPLMLGSPLAVAQDSRYSSDFRAPAAPAATAVQSPVDADTAALLDELDALIDDAAAANAADPVFLQDLRDLSLRYAWPWRTQVVSDDFSDGDYTVNPAWVVASGQFSVEPGAGLRSLAGDAASGAVAADSSSSEPVSTEELAVRVLGQLFAGGAKEEDAAQPAPAPARSGEDGRIDLVTAVPNAFAIRMEVVSAGGTGPLEIGVSQGANSLGYRVAYTPGADVEVLRYGSRGVSVVDVSNESVTLEDGASHLVQFTRDTAGVLAVAIDGVEVVRVTDRGFRDPFDGIILVNQGGDYTVASVAVFGG